MSTQVKWNGKWVDLNLDARNISIANFSIGNSNTPWVNFGSGYKASLQILGMSESNRAVCFLEPANGNITELVCSTNQLEFYSDTNTEFSGVVLYSTSRYLSENKIISTDKLTNEEIERILPQIAEGLHIRQVNVRIGENDYEKIEFLDVRQVTDAVFSRQECTEQEKTDYQDLDITQKILVTYTLQGGTMENSQKVDTIYLNGNDFPVKGITNGVEWNISWEGFDGAVEGES